MNKELEKLLLQQQEENYFHTSPEKEYQFYRRVQQGDLSILEGDMQPEPLEGFGCLSDNPLHNMKYHLIILIAMLSRFCIEGGLPVETAYTMSDMYIPQIDKSSSTSSLSEIKKEAITQFTRTMHELKKQKPLSLPVVRAIDYIDAHITSPLTNREIASAVSCNPDYLSRLFRRETGSPLNHYVLNQKCRIACYLLENSTQSVTDISSFLNFSSCSHFISRFKQLHHITPEQYRRHKARNAFSTAELEQFTYET